MLASPILVGMVVKTDFPPVSCNKTLSYHVFFALCSFHFQVTIMTFDHILGRFYFNLECNKKLTSCQMIEYQKDLKEMP